MRVGSYWQDGQARLGLVRGEQVLDLTSLGKRYPSDFGSLAGSRDSTALWDPTTRSVIESVHKRVLADGIPGDWNAFCRYFDACRWLPPVQQPEKIICIGLNYRDHAAESGMQVPKEPVFFNKYNNALVGASGPVILPSNSAKVDFEAELAVVIGRTAKRIAPEQASAYVGGYMVMHDVSARDWQFRTGQWVSGKTFDSFAPCGPYLVTPDEIPDAHDLKIRLTLNGRVMQDSSTRNLIFGVPVLISYLSDIFTLQPGDIISTGTPPGVGFARKPPVFLQNGDEVEISVERVGAIRHRCVAETG